MKGWRRGCALLGILLAQGSTAIGKEYDCVIAPHRIVKVSAAAPGVIRKVNVERGDRVRKGSVLFQLDARVREAETALAKVKMEYAQREVRRNLGMRKEDLISESKMDELRNRLALAKAELRVAQARLAQYTVRSPIDGVVLEQHHFAGEFVREDYVLKLAQTNPLNVETVLPAAVALGLRPGERVPVLLGPRGEERAGEVRIVEPVIDSASGTVGVQLRLENAQGAVRAGAACRIRLDDGGKHESGLVQDGAGVSQ